MFAEIPWSWSLSKIRFDRRTNLVLEPFKKLEFKKRNSFFLIAEQPWSWSLSKIRVPKKKRNSNFLIAKKNLGPRAFQKLELQKRKNSNFLIAENPWSWSLSKIRVPKKRNSNYRRKTLVLEPFQN